MSDLTNITNLSGLTITSDQTTGTNNPNATFAIANLTQTQINALENVTPYTVNGNTVKVKPGTMVFNITTGQYQIFTALAQWENISTNITTATGIGLTSSPFSVPSGTTNPVETSGANNVNGFVYYNTDIKQFRGYVNNTWSILFLMPGTSQDADPVGKYLDGTIPLLLPTSNNTQNHLELENANHVIGFMYYNTINHNIRVYTGEGNSGWGTITVTNDI